MYFYHFALPDQKNANGQSLVIIRAISPAKAKLVLRRYLREINRGELFFEANLTETTHIEPQLVYTDVTPRPDEDVIARAKQRSDREVIRGERDSVIPDISLNDIELQKGWYSRHV